jgi:tRNA threonylcarbamoyladenosine biosynthesis protein TsaE
MVTCISRSPAETSALGEQWGRAAQSGLVLGLSGDLGTGKTELVKGLARGLDISERVHSPTFALINIYHGGRLTLFHLDLYRLETPQQIVSAGLEEYLHPQGVSVIEWAERMFEKNRQQTADSGNGAPLRWVTIESLSETERRITYEDIGA